MNVTLHPTPQTLQTIRQGLEYLVEYGADMEAAVTSAFDDILEDVQESIEQAKGIGLEQAEDAAEMLTKVADIYNSAEELRAART